MIGAIVGDIAGSRFEFCNLKSKKFVLLAAADEVEWGPPSSFTDDTVMTLAIAQALTDWCKSGSSVYGELSLLAVRAMQDFGRRYPRAGYGGHFAQWISEADPRPYNSWGNGAAMRVSACGRAIRRLAEVPRRRNRALGTRVFDDRQVAVVGEEMVKYSNSCARCAAREI